MRLILIAAAALVLLLQVDTAFAQGAGIVRACSATDKKCQTPGTIAIACNTADTRIRNNTDFRTSANAIRVKNGRWQGFRALGGIKFDCTQVLVIKPAANWRDPTNPVRSCDGGDRSCQRLGTVGLACFLDKRGTRRTDIWSYTGDGMRVVQGQWMMFYSSNNETYFCESVVVGEFNRRSYRANDPLNICSGDDRRCQGPAAVAVACAIERNNLNNPRKWHYNGKAMRVANGRWQMLYPRGQTYGCEDVVVAKLAQRQRPQPPKRPTGGLPRGAVILFDGENCPKGWRWIGEVRAPRSPVSGMSYCQLTARR